MRVAERAGRKEAAKVARMSTPGTNAKSSGSPVPMPCILSASSRVATTLSPIPTMRPTAKTRPVAAKTSLKTARGFAPNAIRIPNSRVRCSTEY